MKLSNAMKQTIKIRQLESHIAYLNGRLSMSDDEILIEILDNEICEMENKLSQLLKECQ